jgi:hypothetical protein
VMYGPISGLKIAVMKEVFASTGNATNVAENEWTSAVFIIAKEVAVARGHFTMQNAAAGELMGDATILATESGASNVTRGGLTAARDTVVGLSGSTSAGSIAVANAKSIVAAVDLMTDVSMSVVSRDVISNTLIAVGTSVALSHAGKKADCRRPNYCPARQAKY